MNCGDLEALWASGEEGPLAPQDEEGVEAHLRSCQRCARLRADLARLEYRLDALATEPAEPPAYLKTRVLARLEEARPRSAWFPLRFLTSRRLLALSVASLAFFAGLLTRELHRVNEWLRKDRAQEVVLELQAPEARLVTLAGDFNAWGRQAERTEGRPVDGRWIFRLRLEPGRYQYSFVVDGKKWLPDPRAPGMIPDGFGGMNSVIYVRSPDRGRSQPL